MHVDTSELESLQGFLRQTGSDSVLAYLGLDADPEPQAVAGALQRRRRWAQARLSNPRYESEARAVLSVHRLLVRALSEPLGDDHEPVEQLRAFWRGLTLAGLPRPQRTGRMHQEAARIGVPADRLALWLVLGWVTPRACAAQDPVHVPAPRPASARPATRDALALARRLTEVVREGVLPQDTLEAVLQSAEDRGLSTADTLSALEASVRRARRARRPVGGPSSDALRAARKEARDALTDLAQQGFLDARCVQVVARQARRNGLSQDAVDALIQDAQAAARSVGASPLIPPAVLEVAWAI